MPLFAVERDLSQLPPERFRSELKGLVYSETPREDLVDPEEATLPWYQRTLPLAGIALVMVLVLNFAF